jgi:hypothetical protein
VSENEYEGYVKYADDSVVSIQCFEQRHAECPSPHDDAPIDGNGPLDGYYCECPCG